MVTMYIGINNVYHYFIFIFLFLLWILISVYVARYILELFSRTFVNILEVFIEKMVIIVASSFYILISIFNLYSSVYCPGKFWNLGTSVIDIFNVYRYCILLVLMI